jgi:predicted nucleotidyltransferase
MPEPPIEERYRQALENLIEQVKEDRSILAALLCGSLSHDRVWARSDIDLVLITIDDKKIEGTDLALYADGVNVHAILFPRSRFRQLIEGSGGNSFMHSFLIKGRLLYTHDETIASLHDRSRGIGERDNRIQLLRAAAGAPGLLDKARKWFVTRGDLDYTALWILHAAGPLAKIEVVGRRLLADREVIPQAMTLNPGFFKMIYTDLLNSKKTRKNVLAALDAADRYLADRAATVFAPVIDHLREAAEVRSCTEIDDYFRRTYDIGGVTAACEYLADRGLIGKASTAVQLTRRSNVSVQELAFFSIEGP